MSKKKKPEAPKQPINHRTEERRRKGPPCGRCREILAVLSYNHPRLQVWECVGCERITLVIGLGGQSVMHVD